MAALDSDKVVEMIGRGEFGHAVSFLEALAMRNEVFMPPPVLAAWKKLCANKLRVVELPLEAPPSEQLAFYRCLRRCFTLLSDDLGVIACWNEELRLSPDPESLLLFCRKCVLAGKESFALFKLKEALKDGQNPREKEINYFIYKLTRKKESNEEQNCGNHPTYQ